MTTLAARPGRNKSRKKNLTAASETAIVAVIPPFLNEALPVDRKPGLAEHADHDRRLVFEDAAAIAQGHDGVRRPPDGYELMGAPALPGIEPVLVTLERGTSSDQKGQKYE